MKKLHVLGDTHLGRKFENGVPLHRRGEREQMVWAQFEDELNVPCEVHVQTGDLFDSFLVPNEVILRAFNLYREAAETHIDTVFVIYRGNHDASRNENRASSFDIFAQLCADIDNVIVIKGCSGVVRNFAFVPWHPFKDADEMVRLLPKGLTFDAVFGHWETQGFNGDTSNQIPYVALKGLTNDIFTGHIHKPELFQANGFTVTVVGSMQPYAHGEEINDELYCTVHLKDLVPDAYKNKCLRIVCKRGEEVPEIDCLSLSFKYVEEGEDEQADIDVQFEEFDMEKIFAECLKEFEVSELISTIVISKFQELRKC